MRYATGPRVGPLPNKASSPRTEFIPVPSNQMRPPRKPIQTSSNRQAKRG